MKNFVVIPAYQNIGNIERLIHQISELKIPDLAIMVVDDASTDGTQEKLAALSLSDPAILFVERLDHRNYAQALQVGFDLALQMGAQRIVQMDPDLSHKPEDLTRLLAALDSVDIAIASRLVTGGADLRPKSRRIWNRLFNLCIRLVLERKFHKTAVSDWTSSFRAYRREVFTKIPPFTWITTGITLPQEILYRALTLGMTAKEIPTKMDEQRTQRFSIDLKVVLQAFVSILSYRVIWSQLEQVFYLGNYRAKSTSKRYFQISKGEDEFKWVHVQLESASSPSQKQNQTWVP